MTSKHLRENEHKFIEKKRKALVPEHGEFAKSTKKRVRITNQPRVVDDYVPKTPKAFAEFDADALRTILRSLVCAANVEKPADVKKTAADDDDEEAVDDEDVDDEAVGGGGGLVVFDSEKHASLSIKYDGHAKAVKKVLKNDLKLSNKDTTSVNSIHFQSTGGKAGFCLKFTHFY